MVNKIVSTGCGNCLQLMVGKPMPKVLPGCGQRIVELIIRIVHPVHPMHGLQAAFVESGIVRHKWQAINQGRHLRPPGSLSLRTSNSGFSPYIIASVIA